MPIVQHDMLRSLCFEIFKATGIPEEDADIISTHLVAPNSSPKCDTSPFKQPCTSL